LVAEDSNDDSIVLDVQSDPEDPSEENGTDLSQKNTPEVSPQDGKKHTSTSGLLSSNENGILLTIPKEPIEVNTRVGQESPRESDSKGVSDHKPSPASLFVKEVDQNTKDLLLAHLIENFPEITNSILNHIIPEKEDKIWQMFARIQDNKCNLEEFFKG